MKRKIKKTSSNNKNFLVSLSFIASLVTVFIIGSITAMSIDLEASNTSIFQGDLVSIEIDIIAEPTDEEISRITLIFDRQGGGLTVYCVFDTNATVIFGCFGMTLNKTSPWNYSYGYGENQTIPYNVTINTTIATVGTYDTFVNVSFDSNPDIMSEIIEIQVNSSETQPNALIYMLRGDDQPTLMEYNVSNESWSLLENAPFNAYQESALAYDYDNYIYALRADNSKEFYRYSISGDSWTKMGDASDKTKLGASIVFDGSDLIYALRGADSKDFWKYNITTNSWSSLTSITEKINAGADLIYDNNNYIYALRGGGTSSFYRYSISGDSWSTMTSTPDTIEEGGDLTYDGDNFIYTLRGQSTPTFYRYSISGNSWLTLANSPRSMGEGASLVYDGDFYIYAHGGDSLPNFHRYTIPSNTWDNLTNTPHDVSWGADSVYKDLDGYSPLSSDFFEDDIQIPITNNDSPQKKSNVKITTTFNITNQSVNTSIFTPIPNISTNISINNSYIYLHNKQTIIPMRKSTIATPIILLISLISLLLLIYMVQISQIRHHNKVKKRSHKYVRKPNTTKL